MYSLGDIYMSKAHVLPLSPGFLRILVPLALCFVPTLAPVFAQQAEVDRLNGLTDRWIELELERAEAWNAWKAQKQIFEIHLAALEDQKKALEAEITEVVNQNDNREAEVESLDAAIAEQREFLQSLESALPGLESDTIGAVGVFPPPLREELAGQIDGVRRAIDGETTALSRRIQWLLTIVTTAERFNNTLTLSSEIRDIGDRQAQIQVLYWGLASGFAVQEQLGKAWILSPAREGWEWAEADEHVREIADLIRIFEKRKEPGIIMLPVSRKEVGS